MKKILEIHNITPDELSTMILRGVESILTEVRKELIQEKRVIWLTRAQTSKTLSVSLVTLHNWSKKGILQAYKIGNRVRYKKDEIEKSIVKINYTNT